MFCKIASHLKLFQLCRNENEIKFIPILACFLNIISFINTVSIHSTHWDTHNIFRGKLESVSIVLRKISARPDFNHFARIQSFQNITIHKVREYLRSGWEYVWKQYKGQISGAHNIHQHGAHMLPIVQRRSQWLSTVSGLTGDHRRIYRIHKFWEAAATQHSHSNVEVASSVLQHHNEEKSLGAAHWMFTQNE